MDNKRYTLQHGNGYNYNVNKGVCMQKIESCPCGRPIDKLFISESGQGLKYANVSGNCCGEWMIEFRANYTDFDSIACMDLAIKAWNNAPRCKK